MDVTTLILSDWIAGHSVTFHLSDKRCLVVDRDPQNFGHSAGFFGICIFDEGSPVSFTNILTVESFFPEGPTDWVCSHVFNPYSKTIYREDEVPKDRIGNYIKEVRCPTYGAFQSFPSLLAVNSEILGAAVVGSVDPERKIVSLTNGTEINWSL